MYLLGALLLHLIPGDKTTSRAGKWRVSTSLLGCWFERRLPKSCVWLLAGVQGGFGPGPVFPRVHEDSLKSPAKLMLGDRLGRRASNKVWSRGWDMDVLSFSHILFYCEY